MLHIENSVVVNRSPEVVFAMGADLGQLADWNTTVLAVTDYATPALAGSTFKQIAVFLGKKIPSEHVVTAYEPHRLFAFKSTAGPVPSEITVTFEAIPQGTRVTEVIEGEPGGFFRLAGPLLAAALNRQRTADLSNLKALIELETVPA